MSLEGTGDAGLDMDVAAATLLSDNKDIKSLLKALAATFMDTLGDQLEVVRAGGLFHKSDEIKSLKVKLSDNDYEAAVTSHGVECTVGHTSGGIRIRAERVEVATWLQRLLGALQQEAVHSAEARQALENVVIGGPTP